MLEYEIEWTGVGNYVKAFIGNSEFTPALIKYLQMIIPYTFIVVVLSFIIAYLLNKIKVGKGVLRTIYFLPVIIMSGPVMTQIMEVQGAAGQAAAQAATSAAAPETTNAYLNIFIMQIIDSYSPALGNALAGVFDQLSIILWFTGIPIVLFINGLQKINPSVYEAAKIDSANAWQIMGKITIPMLKWIYALVVLLLVGFVFLLFRDKKPKDIKARQKQEKKLKKLEKQQKRRLNSQKRHQAKEAKLYGK